VYQKSFVEFFASEQVVERLEKAVEKAKGIVDFLAGNKMVHSPGQRRLYRWLDWVRKGDLRTSVQAAERNAVTWGVFPGQEIVQSTIIEQESFLTWKVRIVYHHLVHLGI
jgi:methylenetetrahydrofolate reductase (NADPH)